MDALDGWTRTEHTADVAGRATTHPVWRRGSGPGVVVIHEMPGLTAGVTRFGDELVAAGHTVLLPHLFGQVGREYSNLDVARTLPSVCVSREFTKLARGVTTPVAGWLRSLARDLHAERLERMLELRAGTARPARLLHERDRGVAGHQLPGLEASRTVELDGTGVDERLCLRPRACQAPLREQLVETDARHEPMVVPRRRTSARCRSIRRHPVAGISGRHPGAGTSGVIPLPVYQAVRLTNGGSGAISPEISVILPRVGRLLRQIGRNNGAGRVPMPR